MVVRTLVRMKEQKQQHQNQPQQLQRQNQQKLLLFSPETAARAQEEREIDSLEKQPFAMGVEALIATIEDKAELIKAIIETRRKNA